MLRNKENNILFVGNLPHSMKGISPDSNLRTLNRVPRTHDRALETGGFHRRQLSLGSIPDTQSLFFLSQAMNGSLHFYRGLEETKALELSTEQRKSRIPVVSHEKENQLHLKAKNLHALPPDQSSKTKLTHSYSSYGDTTPNTKEKGSKFGILYDIKRLA